MTITTLTGKTTKDTNSITDPTHIVPIVTHTNTAAASLPPPRPRIFHSGS